MAATILHDIKNPMGTLRMYAGQIKKKTGSPDEARMADEMIRQVDRLAAMTQEILDFCPGREPGASRDRPSSAMSWTASFRSSKRT